MNKDPSNKVLHAIKLGNDEQDYQETSKIHAISLFYEIHRLRERLQEWIFKADFEKTVRSNFNNNNNYSLHLSNFRGH